MANQSLLINEENFSLTRDYILYLKKLDNGSIDKVIKDNYYKINHLTYILEHLGHLSKGYNFEWIKELVNHFNENIRILAIKNLAKQKNIDNLELYKEIINNDSSSLVKREAASAIGRMRNEKTIPYLFEILKNSDPKIICQGIRGLLVFKGKLNIDECLKKLKDHENEIIRNVINKEYFQEKKNNINHLKHCETYDFLKNVVVKGDVRDIIKLVPDESVHLTFTSPPYYNARDYSIYPSYEAYLKFLEDVFKETLRITKEGRFLIVNTSPVIIPRISRSHSSKRYPIPFDLHYYLAKMGWEFIDDIVWEKPEYSVKNRIGGFQQHRKPLAYKPNTVTEYLMVYRKKTDKLIDWNIRQYNSKRVEESRVSPGFETTNVWKINPKSDKVHSAIFPVELCRRVIEYYSYKDDLVFDPFGGSGTLGRTAKNMDRFFFLTEKEAKYFDYMKSKQSKNNLFQENATRFLTLNQFKTLIENATY